MMPRTLGLKPWLACAALLLATAGAHAAVFELVVLPDTEDYAEFYPSVFVAQGQWIADHKAAENIVFVSHLGDSVHHPLVRPVEWTVATTAMYQLDGLVPYGVCAGNHDQEDKPGYVERFGAPHFSTYDWFRGSSPNGRNHCQVFSAGGYEFLHFTVEKGPSTTTLNWVRDQILANPGKPTIISTHDYLLAPPGGRSSTAGTDIWNAVVKDYPQVFMVLSGHAREVSRSVSINTGGQNVLEMIANYQDYTTPSGETDTGYLRKIVFDTDNQKISVQTYSPTYAGQPWLTSDAHRFAYHGTFLPQGGGDQPDLCQWRGRTRGRPLDGHRRRQLGRRRELERQRRAAAMG